MTSPQYASEIRAPGKHRLLLAGSGSSLRSHEVLHGPVTRYPTARRGHVGHFIAPIEDSGLRGRGGGWFAAGTKMRAVAESAAARRKAPVVVANGMEGEPRSHKDAVLLQRSPHLVLDGIALAAATVGATATYLAIHEGSPVYRTVATAISERRNAGVDPVPVELVVLPPRYVASQESALVQGVMGQVAIPAWGKRPFEQGSFGRPSLVQNVETLAHMALISRHGADWFRAAGTRDAPGTTLVTVGGAVQAPGVVEVDTGTTVSEIVSRAGGASSRVQAFLTGGYGGAFASASFADARWSPELVASAGGVVGAGVLVAIPASACGLLETSQIVTWMAAESAGQCGPCRFGLSAIATDFELLAAGQADPHLIDRLHSRLGVIPGRGACRHPDGVVRLAASALTVFAADVGMHLRGHCNRSAT